MHQDEQLVPGKTFVSVAQQIGQIAQRSPASTAMIGECDHLTFDDIVSRATRLSISFTKTLGGKRGVIAIASDRSADVVVGALAAWRAGCCYLPVDPAGPNLRLQHMLTEADTQIVATTEGHASSIPRGAWTNVLLDGSMNGVLSPTVPIHDSWAVHPDDRAYIIYTSGSTGEPKGVAITHANLKHLVDWHHNAFGVGSHDRGTQFAPLTFDAAVLETWPLLSAGASLYITDRSTLLVPERLRDYLVDHSITLCFAVTPLAEQLIRLPWPSEVSLRFC